MEEILMFGDNFLPPAFTFCLKGILQQQFKKGAIVVDPKSPEFEWVLPTSASKFF